MQFFLVSFFRSHVQKELSSWARAAFRAVLGCRLPFNFQPLLNHSTPFFNSHLYRIIFPLLIPVVWAPYRSESTQTVLSRSSSGGAISSDRFIQSAGIRVCCRWVCRYSIFPPSRFLFFHRYRYIHTLTADSSGFLFIPFTVQSPPLLSAQFCPSPPGPLPIILSICWPQFSPISYLDHHCILFTACIPHLKDRSISEVPAIQHKTWNVGDLQIALFDIKADFQSFLAAPGFQLQVTILLNTEPSRVTNQAFETRIAERGPM